MTSETELRLRKVEALRDLAAARLPPPERERVLGILDAAAGRRLRSDQESARADPVIRNAEEKLAQAEADREEKRRPYEADPLFMYLWRRRFGTRDYQASNLVRYFDRKVAHLVGFEAARVNYAMLLELPDRMREHLESLKRERQSQGRSGDTRRSHTLSALEQQPEIAALLRDAKSEPGAQAPLLRRLEDIDRALDAMLEATPRGESRGGA